MKKYIYLCCIIVLFGLKAMSQSINHSINHNNHLCSYREKKLAIEYHRNRLPYTQGWIYDTINSDEFDGTTIDTNKWIVSNETWHSPNIHVGFVNFPSNVRTEDGKLYLEVTMNTDSIECCCSWDSTEYHCHIPELISGWLTSSSKIRYGYFETECYLPKNHNYWPCFWTCRRDTEINDYDEVDVFERTSSNNTNLPNVIRQNCYNKLDYPDVSKTTQILTFDDSITGKSSVFGVEILPEEVVFYINGHVSSHLRYNSDASSFNTWNTFSCSDIEQMLPMRILLTLTCDPTQTNLPLPHESAWFEYFRCYKLDRGGVETYHPVVFIPSDESTLVYPHVIIGGTGCTANVTVPTALWAEQDIILDKGFELSASTPFSARVISVPKPEISPLYKQNCYY